MSSAQRAVSMKSISSRSASGSLLSCAFQRLSYQGLFSKTERTTEIVVGPFPLHDLVCNPPTQHVAGDVPGQGVQGKYEQRQIYYDRALTTHLALANSYRSCPKLSHAQSCIMR
jgi:hypothetical protein